ncbi:DNA polymerase II large subunit, partial [Candidatus Micrarchaeota archaeon CG_4_10_14_0_8_um_filter_60_7]
MTIASPRMQEYFSELTQGLAAAYAEAGKARLKGLDAAVEVEIPLASDVAARVEGLVGPKGVAVKIRELLKAHKVREPACFALCDAILAGEFGEYSKEEALERAVRAGLALFTEGVVSAPIEGISRVKVRQNNDGSSYAALYFAGPIRGAGGTGQAFSLLLADHCRRKLGLAEFRPTGDEVERYVEESNLYSIRTRAGQYTPTEDELRLIINSCPVCVDGEPTEDYEVSVHKAKGGEPNRVRGGVCLVLSEGLCLKSAKVLKIAKNAGLDWAWIEALVKNKDKAGTQERKVKPISKYMEDLVGGRPVFGYPMRPGGFRLRYGRSPFCGIQAKAITSASMEILGEFPVIGTQLKTERPGKGCIVTICDDMDGPIVLLDDGSVKQVHSHSEALGLKGRVQKILFNGDILINYGDFAKPNHPLVPGAWCDEWFSRVLEAKGVQGIEPCRLSWKDALALSREKGVPLAPRQTLYWCDLARGDLKALADWICEKGSLSFEWFELEGLLLPNDGGKRFLEELGLEHEVGERGILLKGDSAAKLLEPLGLVKDGKLDKCAFEAAFAAPEKTVLSIVSELLGAEVKNKAGTYIGTSMGRPEKSRERAMAPPVHSLFPVALLGGKTRDIVKAVQSLKRRGEGFVEFELNNRACPNCGAHSWKLSCPACSERTAASTEKPSMPQRVDLPDAFDGACNRLHYRPPQLKAVMGLISAGKVPEALEKGILRSKHDVTVFRDGTCRFDATEIPATHFKAAEAGIPLEK